MRVVGKIFPKFSGLFPPKSLKLPVSVHYIFGLDPPKEAGMKHEISFTNETKLNVRSNQWKLGLKKKKSLKIVRGFQADLAKSNISIFLYSTVSECICN